VSATVAGSSGGACSSRWLVPLDVGPRRLHDSNVQLTRVLTSALLLCVCCVCASVRPVAAQQCPDGTPPPCRAAPRRTAPLPAPGSRQRPFTIVAELDGTAPADVRAAAKNLIISALDESGVIAALPEDQVRLGLTLAGKPEATRVDVTTARELAVRGSVRTVVTGTIDRVGQTYHVAVRVLNADSSVVVAARRGIAQGTDDLIRTLDRVVRDVRADLGEHQTEITANRRLEQAVTSSFAAFQQYQRARELNFRGDYLGARGALKEALALDPDFAAAWRSLSAIYFNLGFSDSSWLAVDSALARPERLVGWQRADAESRRAYRRGDDDAALEAAEQVQRLGGSPVILSNTLEWLGRYAEAAALYEAWERRSPFGLLPLESHNLVLELLKLGRIDEARRRAESISGDLGTWSRLRVSTWTADWSTAETLATRLLERTRNPRWRKDTFIGRASAAAARGRVREALEILSNCPCGLEQLVLRTVSGSPVTSALDRTPSAATPAEAQLLAALWAAAASDTTASRQLLARVRSLPPEERVRLDAMAALVDAWLAWSGARPAEVVRLLRRLAEHGIFSPPSLTQPVGWMLASAYERLGQLDSATAALERLAAWRDAAVIDGNRRGLTHSFAHQRLVVLYARMGRAADARRHWRVFSETFTTPDPELVHLVDEARAAVASAERRP